MSDTHYPTIDADFLRGLISSHPRVIPGSEIRVNNSVAYVMVGNKPINKRIILTREISPNQLGFISSTAVAIRLGFIGELLTWLVENRNWKDGAYIVPANIEKDKDNKGE